MSGLHLVELTDIPQMEPGAPMPIVLADEQRLSIFYRLRVDRTGRNETDRVAVLRFKHAYWHRLGPPNEEALTGHPLSKHGLRRYQCVEVFGSRIIAKFCRQNRVHQYHRDSMFEGDRHFVLTFHDSVAEVVARGYEVETLGSVPIWSAARREIDRWNGMP